MTKFLFIFSRKWHFFEDAANQRQAVFNILARTGVFWCYKGQKIKDQVCVGLVTASWGYFLLKPLVICVRHWSASFGEGVFQIGLQWDVNQVGWEGRADCKSCEKIWDPWKQRFCPVCYQGAWEKATHCVSLSYFFLWTGKRNRIGNWNLTCLFKTCTQKSLLCFHLLFINMVFTGQLSFLRTCY